MHRLDFLKLKTQLEKKQERTNEKQMNDKPHCTAGMHKQCEQQFNTDNGHFVRVKYRN